MSQRRSRIRVSDLQENPCSCHCPVCFWIVSPARTYGRCGRKVQKRKSNQRVPAIAWSEMMLGSYSIILSDIYCLGFRKCLQHAAVKTCTWFNLKMNPFVILPAYLNLAHMVFGLASWIPEPNRSLSERRSPDRKLRKLWPPIHGKPILPCPGIICGVGFRVSAI